MGLGRYSIATATGLIVATGAADALIWACHNTHASRKIVIERLRVNAVVTGAITTAVPYDLAAYFASSFTVPPDTGQAAATLTGRNQARKTAGIDPATLAAIYTLTTLAAGMTGHTFTLDSQAMARISGASGTVIGTQFFGAAPATLLDYRNGEEIELGENEGIAIRAPLAGPATGTFRVAVNLDWRELAF
jgi:hypothetical protein